MGRLKEKCRGKFQVWLVSWGKTVTGIRSRESDVKVKRRKPVCSGRLEVLLYLASSNGQPILREKGPPKINRRGVEYEDILGSFLSTLVHFQSWEWFSRTDKLFLLYSIPT